MPYRVVNDEDEGTLEEGNRTCRACGIRKPMRSFSWVGKARKYRFRKCSECCTAEAKDRRNKDPEANRITKFKIHLRTQYGISYETYLEIVENQNNKCAICSGELTDPHLDHCHETGKVRGILCFTCNTALGKFKDSVPLLQSAISYLEKPELDIEYISNYLTPEERSALARAKRARRGSSRTQAHSASVRGSNSPTTSLTEDDVRQIRLDYASGSYTQRMLGEKYGLGQGAISAIVLQKNWAHVE